MTENAGCVDVLLCYHFCYHVRRVFHVHGSENLSNTCAFWYVVPLAPAMSFLRLLELTDHYWFVVHYRISDVYRMLSGIRISRQQQRSDFGP
jgi:hypothetical protein